MASSALFHLHAFVLLLFLPSLSNVFTLAKIDCTIDIRKSMSAYNDSPPWISPSGEFAFGFRSLENTKKEHYLLAIWFNKIPHKTIVWFANGDSPAPRGSRVELTENGELVLYTYGGDQCKEEIWKAKTNGTRSTCAAMLDTGNLVLLNGDHDPIWETFKEPTNTILPGQILGMPSNLTSRESNTDYSTGRFQLHLQPDGNLVLYTVSQPTGNTLGSYWATGIMGKNSQLIFDENGYIYLKEVNASTYYNLTTENPGPKENFYYMAKLESDGVFKQYKYSKDFRRSNEGCSRSDWSLVQQTPDNICLAFNRDLGSGVCGFNSYCQQSDPLSVHSCECPQGYSHLDLYDKSKGCKPDFQLPSCKSDGWERRKELVDFTEINDTDWPLSDYDLHNEVDEERCKEYCRHDCFCVAAIFRQGNCWKKKFPLSNGRKDKSVNGTAFIKVPTRNSTEFLLQHPCENPKDRSTLILVGSLLLGSSVFLNFLLLLAVSAAVYFSFQKKLLNLQSASNTSSTNIRSYTYKELEEATGNFKQTLGKGAFGTVYKGVLGSHTKRFVAVKRLDKVVQEGEKEFKTEVNVIGQTHHKNLVRLLGYCDEGEHRLLVYEYMSNGSLATFLFGISKPDWNQRVQIAVGIARGLMYLHEECMIQIIHCDIKPQNILLDEYYTPRISDFGLAKLLLAEQTRVAHTGMRGTIGYFAPEWFWKASISVKVDVYSFGVMLLEIICCNSSVSFAMQNQEQALMDWVYECYRAKKLDKLVENDEEAKNDMKRLVRLVMVAIWCIQEDPSLRPSMKKVTQMLEGVVEVSVAPRPFMYSSSTSFQKSMSIAIQ